MMGSKPSRGTLAAAVSGMALLAVGCGSASAGHAAAGLPSASAARASSSVTAPAGSSGAACTGSAGVYSAAGSPGQVPSLAAVQFVSARQGWVAGDRRILSTTDGGHTWQRQYAGPAGIDQLDFVNARDGWAVAVTGLLKTADGGSTWTPAADPCGSIRSVHFVTPDLGYAIAGGSQIRIDGGLPAPATGGELLATTDGGGHWAAVAGAPARAQTACFSSATTGYLGTPGKIWRTVDGGRNWTLAFAEPASSGAVRQATPDTTVLQCAGGAAADALFLGTGAAMGHAPYLAYAIANSAAARALFEETYMESAARPQVHAPDGPGSYPGPFSVISPGAAVFVGFNPAVGYGAATLMTVTGSGISRGGNVSGISKPYGAAFVSATQGWVVGENARTGAYGIEATSDGGHSWASQYQTR